MDLTDIKPVVTGKLHYTVLQQLGFFSKHRLWIQVGSFEQKEKV